MLLIPNKIVVGFSKRGGTFDGKLAFVVYRDGKGVLRKETSFNDWRDHSIDPVEFDNMPTSGMMLNFGTRGTNYGWDSRQAFIRVYDPRGFEFEIDPENLVYLLKNSGYDTEKGFGEIVYGFQNGKLVLVPTASDDYKGLKSDSEKVLGGNTIKTADLVVGNVYIRKSGDREVYLGRFDAWSEPQSWEKYEQHSRGKQHVFLEVKPSGAHFKAASPSGKYLHDDGPVDWKDIGRGYKWDNNDVRIMTCLQDAIDEWLDTDTGCPIDTSLDKIVFLDEKDFVRGGMKSFYSDASNGQTLSLYAYTRTGGGLEVHRNGDNSHYWSYGYRYDSSNHTPESLVAKYRPYVIATYLRNGRLHHTTPRGY